MQERVVITGMGTVNPIGLTVEESWKNAVDGVSGYAPITLFDPTNLPVQSGCEVKDFQPEKYMSVKEVRRRDRFAQFASVAAQEAIRKSGLIDNVDVSRVAVIISSGIGGIITLEDTVLTMHKEGPRRVSPLAVPMLMSNAAAGIVAIDHGFQGPCFSVASACASGADAIGIASVLIRNGIIDVAIAGASEAAISKVGVASLDRMGAVSKTPDQRTPRPFDLHRDGFVVGEGAGILVLEREGHARARGARIYAEMAGYAATADAYHITAPAENGSGAARAMQKAMQSAGISLENVDYINAHGTATQLNDAAESKAIKATFGDMAYNIPVSSTKSMTGHMMGATGALEAIFCVMAIRDHLIPPTIHYETPDPLCDLDYVPNQAREKLIKIAMSNAFGFGGHNAVLVIREI